MLKFNFTRIFEARGIIKPFSYLTKAGYSGNFATRIAHNRIRKLNLDEVERLCEMLQCTPNDLLEWVPTAGNAADEKHPLNSLKREKSVASINQMLKSIPLNRLADIENLIKKEMAD